MLFAQGEGAAFAGFAGSVILFVCALAGFTICTLIYSIFASHYFLVTVIESSSGQDEVHYPDGETIAEWWWKPILCGWLLAVWIIPGVFIVFPSMFHSMHAFLISLGLLLWFVFPLGVISTLYTQNWFFYMHPVILWRMLTHTFAFGYVHLATSLIVAAAVALVFGTVAHSLWWIVPAAVVVPAAQLLYARHWGRFAWLSLNFAPRRKKRPRSPDADLPGDPDMRGWGDYDLPEPEVEGTPPPDKPKDDGAKAPPMSPVQEEEDQWAAVKNPYQVADDGQPTFQESASSTTAATVPVTPAPAPVIEDEDEWATDKKPYVTTETPEREASPSEANKPTTHTDYFDKRDRKEKAAKAKAKRKAEENFMPKPSKKTPTFQTALLAGVWPFLLAPRTVRVWTNLIILTVFELLILSLLGKFMIQ